ncbi:hypothetical protein [Halomonas lysinitropha]|uniref:Uncharacterized protein n=1 Tax=Halomonas lysinitropha TaxID=2607506 RepID=A0A5K1IAJ3_9GAMM|nr:hypothetical protein [Halomonas lysinitropha]VVZ94949.1 hypothetical protein HALO32_01013 [Halomonas lysinitropha]
MPTLIEPILRDFKNIECRDALIEYDSRDPELDEHGAPVTIWDGISMKVSPTTGELIPDETGRAIVYRYHNPRRAEWPEAQDIVDNPRSLVAGRRVLPWEAATSMATDQEDASKAAATPAKGKATFPKAMPEQLRVLREALAKRPHTVESLAKLFKCQPRKAVEDGLLSLVAVGRAEYQEETGTWYAAA